MRNKFIENKNFNYSLNNGGGVLNSTLSKSFYFYVNKFLSNII